MLAVLSNRTYRHLFLAQVVALVGTGLATVALGLLAYDLAGPQAGMVLGMALMIKMIAYVLIAPVAGAFADRLPRRKLLVSLDLVRAAVALSLPFVTQIWQIYVLIFLLQSASAAFTPTFQATIPDILTDEADYTRALSLSRLAYDTEALLSPALAALLLTVISFDTLFLGTVAGFLASGLLIVTVALPSPTAQTPRGIYDRTTRGLRIYLATPRLRGLLGLSLMVAAGSSMVLVNTVVVVRTDLGLGDGAVAIAMGAFGAGSMLAALALPPLLDRIPDRALMIGAATAMALTFVLLAVLVRGSGLTWGLLLTAWGLTGLFYSAIQTPGGRLLRRSAHPEDRPALFAAQFALSHACWLLCYPLAGWVMSAFGLTAALLVLAAVGALGLGAALRLWPAGARRRPAHSHPDLPADHDHILQEHAGGHSHVYVIDDLHRRWPDPQR